MNETKHNKPARSKGKGGKEMEKKGRILIIDDDPDVLETLRKGVLSSGDYEVAAVAGAGLGLRVLQNKEIKVVITDVDMPGMDGIDFLKKARTIRPETKVIVLSGRSTEDEVAKAREYGADAFYVKPVDLQALLQHVEELYSGL